jgi:hypothetical protein
MFGVVILAKTDEYSTILIVNWRKFVVNEYAGAFNPILPFRM